MIALTTERLSCTLITESDWSFFLALQQHPQVMRYVADSRSEEEIRAAFDARLHPWTPGAEHWLCLVVRDAAQTPLGITGYIHRDSDCAEVGFLFSPQAQGKRLWQRVAARGLRLRLPAWRYTTADGDGHRR